MGCSLRAVGLSYTYAPGIIALDGVDFGTEQGEFAALLGPNGSGKTTLLRHFNGLLRPTQGRVLIDGRDVSQAPSNWLHSTVGFVFQDPNDQLFAATVGEDVAFGPRNMGLSPSEVDERVKASLEIMELTGLETRPVHGLSFGQKRRVALAGVLAMSPSVLVLDEPTAGLDPLSASRLMALLHRLNRRDGVTIVVATHDVDLVPPYAQRIWVMNRGRVTISGTPPEVFRRTDLMRRSDLRIPRAAQILQLVGAELGRTLEDIPITLEGLSGSGEALTAGSMLDRLVNYEVRARRGFTTGAAAAAAARAAAEMLFHGRKVEVVELRSPIGATLQIPVRDARLIYGDDGPYALATVVKDAGNARDVTDGAEICATVAQIQAAEVVIEGGEGVGTVIKRGLSVPVGRPAINPVPEQMIADAVNSLLPHNRGAKVVISVPGGEALAERTLNIEMGIVGGIAILGTTGLVYDNETWETMGMTTGVVLLGHGSRAAEANEAMYQVIDLVKQLTGHVIVEPGFMGLNEPSIADGVTACVAQGATRIVLIPYFLHLGNHVQKDLPETVDEMRRLHPQVEFTLGQHLGFHPELARIVVERIREASEGDDKGQDGA